MTKPASVTQYRLTEHARAEMARRQISESDIARVLSAPEQAEDVRQGRMVYQSRIASGEASQVYLLWVFVDVDREPAEVVTVYRTSKIGKYWRVTG